MSELGDKLRKVRIDKGLSQQDVATMTGIKYKTINDYENGKSRPDVEKLAILCEAYNTSADYFINVKIDAVSRNPLTDNELEHIRKYRSLDDYGKKAVDMTLDNELYRARKQNVITQRDVVPYVPEVLAASRPNEEMTDVDREDLQDVLKLVAKEKQNGQK